MLNIEKYITAEQAAEKWGISTRRVQKLCSEGKILSAKRFGKSWAISEDEPKPVDGRLKKSFGIAALK